MFSAACAPIRKTHRDHEARDDRTACGGREETAGTFITLILAKKTKARC